jgi:hypothetical protein
MTPAAVAVRAAVGGAAGGLNIPEQAEACRERLGREGWEVQSLTSASDVKSSAAYKMLNEGSCFRQNEQHMVRLGVFTVLSRSSASIHRGRNYQRTATAVPHKVGTQSRFRCKAKLVR